MNDTKIYLITFKDKNDNRLVSHGIGNNTLDNYCLPPEPIRNFEPRKDEHGLYIAAGDE